MKPVHCPSRLKIGFLYRVLRVGVVEQNTARGPVKHAVVSPHNDLERLIVPARGSLCELELRHFWRRRRFIGRIHGYFLFFRRRCVALDENYALYVPAMTMGRSRLVMNLMYPVGRYGGKY